MRKVIRYGDIIFSSGDVERTIVYKYLSKQEQVEHRQILDDENTIPSPPDKAAMIAPTIITEEIAFVTDINGVCKEGVTLHTT